MKKIKILKASIYFSIDILLGTSILILMIDLLELLGGNDGIFETLHPYWISVGCILLIKALFSGQADLIEHYAGFDITERMRHKMIEKLKSYSLGFYTQERIGELSTIIHKDVDTIELVAAHLWSRMLGDIIVTIALGGFLLFTNWQMFIAMILLLPIGVFSLLKGIQRNLELEKDTKEEQMTMVSLFVEYTKGIPLLKAYQNDVGFEQKISNSAKLFGEKSKNIATHVALYIGKYNICLELSYGFMLLVGVLGLIQGYATLTEFLLFSMVSKEFYKPFSALESSFLNYVKAEESYTRIAKLLESPSITDSNFKPVFENFDIQYKNMMFSYGKDFSMHNLSTSIKTGQKIALVGPSGSGKTTFSQLLLRFYDVNEGSITIGNHDIRNIKYDYLLQHISIVMQNITLFNDTILENIRIANPDATRDQIIDATKKAMIHDFITSLPDGYDTILSENGSNLSGGQKQRLSIARALIKDAPIVILDEATSNVDPINERKIQTAISNLSIGRTVLIIAHNLNTIKHVDNILVFQDGQIVESGCFNNLLTNNQLFAQLYNSQTMAKNWMIS